MSNKWVQGIPKPRGTPPGPGEHLNNLHFPPFPTIWDHILACDLGALCSSFCGDLGLFHKGCMCGSSKRSLVKFGCWFRLCVNVQTVGGGGYL